ncbi:YceG family protein [Bacillus sp. 1P06AnD]|uniref:YceG family protein n=1 Tax=Bacillus sp. 1P06AnD TaxID=3132208 RepID=UPI0039A3A50A
MKQLQIQPILYTSTDDWLNTFLSSSKERPLYKLDEEQWQFSRIGLRILGVPLDEDDYYNSLFDMKTKPYIHVLSEELDKTIQNDVFKSIQELLEIHQREPKGLSIKRLIAFMIGKGLLPKHHDPFINHHIQTTVISIVELFQNNHNQGLQSQEFRRFLIDLVKWMRNHLEKWIASLSIGDDFPKVVWYGNCSQSQLYFLMLLMEFGCDVLIFHPEGTDLFAQIDSGNTYSVTYAYSNKGKLEDFPKQSRDRQTTVAYRANKQLEIMMNDVESGVFKPWQFRHFIPSPLTMRMTYDDIFIYAKETAMIRPQFKVEKNKVYIPNIFSKIQGISKNQKEYWDRINDLQNLPLSLLVQQFPFSPMNKSNYHFHYTHSLDKGELSVDKMMKGNWWRYGHLPNELQTSIAEVIKEYCEHPKLNKTDQEKDQDLQVFLLKQASMIPERILQMMQKFDYSQEIPKIILYNNGEHGNISREDAALLLFLNEFGFDIILYNPAGHNDIEAYIDSSHFDVHWLEDVAFNQPFKGSDKKEHTLFSKFIKRIF